MSFIAEKVKILLYMMSAENLIQKSLRVRAVRHSLILLLNLKIIKIVVVSVEINHLNNLQMG